MYTVYIYIYIYINTYINIYRYILYMIVYLQNYICLYIAHCEFWLPQPTRWLTATAGRQKQGFCRSVRAHIVLTKVTVLALCCRHIVCWFSSQRDYGNQMDYGDGDNGSWYFPPQLLLLTVTELKTAAQKKERLFCETKNSASERLATTCAEAASACCSCCCSCFLRSWSWCSSEEEASAAGRAGVEVTRMGELSRREGPSDTCGTRSGGETCSNILLLLARTRYLCRQLSRLQLSNHDLDVITAVQNTFWPIMENSVNGFQLLISPLYLPFILYSS